MKKYTALLLMIASLAGLVWASVLSIRMALAPAPALLAPESKNIPAIDGEEALQRLDRLDLVLGQIDRLKQFPPQVAAGPLAQPAALPVSTTAQNALQENEAPVISLVYLSPDMQRAVINGNLYATGDLLPDGSRLADISMDQITTDIGGRRKVWQVPRNQVMGSTAKPVKKL